ncbi:MAG: type IX secretion system sortase PorU, partial [Sphingobacteriales bacterium]
GNPIASLNLQGVGTNSESNPIYATSPAFLLPSSGSSADFLLTYTPGTATGKGYLDFIELNLRRALRLQNGQTAFRDWKSVGPASVASYKIQQANGSVKVWDITNPLHPAQINGSLSGSEYVFSQDATRLHEFIAFDGSQFHTADYIGKVANQNLHATQQVDYILVTHKDFLPAADKLADFHRQHNQYRVVVATTEQIYNEFSSGSQDIGAIRDFARMFYKRAGMDTMEMPRYLLLLGDASFDYKDRLANNTNFVPTYETSESVNLILGYCSDDYFSLLDDNEDIENWAIANTMDLGVGRLPVTTPGSAMDVVDKIISYTKPQSLGPWRISTTIISDNGDSETHFYDGEIMASIINQTTNLYNESKVYLSAIPTVSTPGGLRAPEANKAINDAVFKGTFLMNYNGHGSITTMAHERILTQDDFNNWKNSDRLPVMVTATCDFSKYDDPSYVSAGEKLMVKPDGGVIALLTTTQLVYAHLNRPMNTQYLDAMFRQYNGEWGALGDVFRYSKNATYSTPKGEETLANYRKFVLLGDPGLIPAFPKHRVATDAIINGDTQEPADTLKALGKYQISGSIKDGSDQVISDFNGRLFVTIYDKPRKVTTLSTPSNTFKVQNNIIYKGKATVKNGLFSFTFIAPKDLNYDFGKGKISYYAENGITDAAGADTNMHVGGFAEFPVVDNNPPVVKPYMGDSLFKDGGITGSNTLLYVQLNDETGINVSGNGIGHDLTAVLDENIEIPYILNDYYETAPNDFMRGYVRFPINGLADGRHSIRVKAWDMNNNSGEGTVNFEVVNGSVMQVQNLMNYPNPFSDRTHFVFDHNHPDEALRVDIHIFSTSGVLVRTISEDYTPAASRSGDITWDGTDNNGAKLPSGIYVYKISLSTEKGIQAVAHQKLVLVR